MAEQKYTQKTTPPDMALYPAEGRVDVANDVEEEQRAAYSSHNQTPSSQGGAGKQQKRGDQALREPSANSKQAELPPVEGRVDVAGDVEEEQRNAYSSHHA